MTGTSTGRGADQPVADPLAARIVEHLISSQDRALNAKATLETELAKLRTQLLTAQGDLAEARRNADTAVSTAERLRIEHERALEAARAKHEAALEDCTTAHNKALAKLNADHQASLHSMGADHERSLTLLIKLVDTLMRRIVRFPGQVLMLTHFTRTYALTFDAGLRKVTCELQLVSGQTELVLRLTFYVKGEGDVFTLGAPGFDLPEISAPFSAGGFCDLIPGAAEDIQRYADIVRRLGGLPPRTAEQRKASRAEATRL